MPRDGVDYGNEKLNQIFDYTWPNLGWAKRMTHNLPDKDDAPWLDSSYDGFMTHEEMLEEAAKREKEAEVMRIAIKFIDEHSEALKELRKIEHEELMEELQSKKKENFQLVADACMKEYEQKYQRDVFPVDEHWVYMVSEYFGTGEGQTVCIMMTQAVPGHVEDFETSTNKYVACTSQQYRAVRAFHEEFGTWHLHGLRFLSKEDFFSEYSYYIPPVMMKLSNKSCYKDFHTRVHYNFS